MAWPSWPARRPSQRTQPCTAVSHAAWSRHGGMPSVSRGASAMTASWSAGAYSRIWIESGAGIAARYPRKDSRTWRSGLSTLRSTSATDCQVPSASAAADDRHRRVRRDQRGQHVRPAVAARAVRVPPAVVGGQQVGQHGQQVVRRCPRPVPGSPRPAVACGTNTCSRPSPPAGGLAGEPLALAGDVVHDRRAAGVHLEASVVFMASGPQVGGAVQVEYRAAGPPRFGRGEVDDGGRDLLRLARPGRTGSARGSRRRASPCRCAAAMSVSHEAGRDRGDA